MDGTERSSDEDRSDGGDSGTSVERADAGSGSDDDLVASEGVNETGGSDSPGGTLGDDEPAEPNEPG